MSGLPSSWVITELIHVGDIKTGNTPSTKTPEFYGGTIPFVKPSDLEKPGYISTSEQYLSDDGAAQARTLRSGAVLVSCIGNLGKTGITKTVVATNQQINSVEFYDSAVVDKYGYYVCKTLKPWMENEASATTIAILNKSRFSTAPFPLAPLPEQKRIADKLDTVLARVDACRERLNRVPLILKRFKQSVLAAATSGKLTEDWRTLHGINESNVSKLLSEVADVVDPHPSHRTPATVLKGVPYIGIGEVDKNGVLDLSKAKTVSWDVFTEHQKRYEVRHGDFIFGKIGTLGRPTLLPVDAKYVVSANVILIQPNQKIVNAAYLLFFFSSPKVLMEIAGQANSTSQAAFGIKKMRAFPLWIPSMPEQNEIVRRVETLFAFADRLEARLATARNAAERLTPALLAKAFRGELVPQDPDDEPASLLLQRLANRAVEGISKTKSSKRKAIADS